MYTFNVSATTEENHATIKHFEWQLPAVPEVGSIVYDSPKDIFVVQGVSFVPGSPIIHLRVCTYATWVATLNKQHNSKNL